MLIRKEKYPHQPIPEPDIDPAVRFASYQSGLSSAYIVDYLIKFHALEDANDRAIEKALIMENELRFREDHKNADGELARLYFEEFGL